MQHLSIDIETYSEIDIKKCGLYKYVESDTFEILLFAYSVDFAEVTVIDIASGETIPANIIEALRDSNVTKHAYNATFEVAALNKFLGSIAYEQWIDTMLLGLYQGYPAGLGAICDVLQMQTENAKQKSGKALINYFSKPCKPTKVNGGRTRNLPHHDKDKWQLFKDYNAQDVTAEMTVYKKLCEAPLPESEKALAVLDYRVNAHGVRADTRLIEQIIDMNDKHSAELMQKARTITGLANPNSPIQLKAWLNSKGANIKDMTAETIEIAIDKNEGEVKEILEIRQALSKTSVKKYEAMLNCVNTDSRIRGLFQFYGSKTGRWAGRLVQLHNLKRNNIPALDVARELARGGNTEVLDILYGNLSEVFSNLCRTAFTAPHNKKLIIADFSAIEARVIAWLAGEQWVLDSFNANKDIYCETASQMFGVKVEKHGANSELRQKGKIATLACGYGGSVGALKAMGADKMGLSDDELAEIVKKYRSANKNIVKFWRDCEDCCKAVIHNKTALTFGKDIKVAYRAFNDGRTSLTIRLPSGRDLFYPEPFLTINRFGNESIGFKGMGTNFKWGNEETYGGKLAENITQAVARDCLAEALIRASELSHLTIVMHVHDEIVCEAPSETDVKELCALMSKPISWAVGLPLSAAGFESEFYKKD